MPGRTFAATFDASNVHRVSGEPHKPAIQTRNALRVQLAGAE